MDDRRFDSLTKSLARGASRRSVFKGLLGLGGAAVVGATVLEDDTEAARRPTPTPRPVRCPGRQTWNGSACVCPGDAPNKCGPDCCTGKTSDSYPRPPDHTECCDNACCDGTCYGEELCCPTNTRPGELPPTHIVCDGPSGKHCFEGNCCNDGDCDDPCLVCNLEAHICVPRCDESTQVCCTEQAGPGECVDGECCLGAPCGDQQVCCQAEGGTICCPPSYTCEEGRCVPPCLADVEIFVQTHGALNAPGVCPPPFANVVTEVGLYPYANGACGTTAIATATTSANGPASFSNIPGGHYCALPTDGELAACLDCPDYGWGVGVDLEVPCSGTFKWTIGVDSCCVEGVDVNIFAGTNNGDCGQSGTIAGVDLGLYDCDSGELLYGPATTGADGRASFTGVAPGHYCAHATDSSSYSGCEVCPTGGPSFDVECPTFNGWTVLFEDCGECQVCSSGTCVAGHDGVSCGSGGSCCDGDCLTANQLCNGGTCCPGGFCDGNGDCCPPPNVGCNGGTCCAGFCDGNGDCCPAPNVGCNGGVCCSVACDQNGDCSGACEPNCDCSDPANDGYDCNGGLDAGGGVCGCGWCVVPLEGCPCGCDGDTECIRCIGGGVCETYNQGGSCNGGDGICDGEWCVAPPACTDLDDPCSADSECCSGLCQTVCVTCKTYGGSCSDDGDCCGGYDCIAGHCLTP